MQYIYKVKASCEFCASVMLGDISAKCAQPHGYTYLVEAVVSYNNITSSVGLDYNLLGSKLQDICQQLDYCHLNDNLLLSGIEPSCENVAKIILEYLVDKLSLEPGLEICIELSTRKGRGVSVSCIL